MEVVDAHLHVWNLSRSDYSWIAPRGPYDRSFTPQEAQLELQDAGVTGAVLVQADDTDAETAYLLESAAEHHWILGVVGWIPLEQPRRAAAALDRLSSEPSLKGVRQLLHTDPRDDLLRRSESLATAQLLARAGLVLDIPDAWPRHLDDTTRLAEQVPDLTIVLDHLAKPPTLPDDFEQWLRSFRAAGRNENIVVKYSGLHTGGVPRPPAEIRKLLDLALHVFGPERILFGGDWPITLPGGGYAAAWQSLLDGLGELSQGEHSAILGKNARRVYGLPAAAGRAAI